MSRGPRWWVGLVVLASLSACASIPDSGPLRAGESPDAVSSAAPFDFSPPGPEPGATPEDVVRGFLAAQQATPSSTTVARSFLTERADARWAPDRGTLLYREADVEAPATTSGQVPVSVRVAVAGVFALDSTGRWQGRQPRLEQDGINWTLVSESGEWRIADPPDALMLPLSHVDNRFQRLSVYFADPTGSILVPEPIYLPIEVQTPTALVEALLAGPQDQERRADRTFLPADSELQVSVPVTRDGVALVPLSGELVDLDRTDLLVAVAQLVWTLRQVPEVSAVSVSVDGEPVVVPDIGVEVPVGALDRYSPVGAAAATDLYGLREGSVRRVVDGRESSWLPLPRGVRPTSLAVSLLGNPLAVGDAAGRVRVLARGSDGGRARALRTVETSGVSALAWDWSRTLWIGPRRVGDDVLALVGDRVRRLRWPDPALRGRRVDSFTVSRDGTRVVLAVATPGGGGSELWSARVTRSADQSVGPVALGGVQRVSAPRPLPPVVEVGWSDPQTLAVLVRRDPVSSRLLSVPVDGQRESGVLTDDSDVLFGTAVAAAVSPVDGEALVLTDEGQVHVLSEEGRWRVDPRVERPLRLPTFVG